MSTTVLPAPIKFTPMQQIVAAMVGEGHNYNDCAEHLGITRATVKFHAERAAEKIPGDLPVQFKLVVYRRLSQGRDLFTGKFPDPNAG